MINKILSKIKHVFFKKKPDVSLVNLEEEAPFTISAEVKEIDPSSTEDMDGNKIRGKEKSVLEKSNALKPKKHRYPRIRNYQPKYPKYEP